MTSRISRTELILAGATLFMFAEAFVPRLLSPAAADVTGLAPESTLLRYLWLPFYGVVIAGIFIAGRKAFGAMLRSPWLIGLALLAIGSAAWSIEPDLSFRRGIALLATTLLGVYLAARYDWISVLRLLGVVWLTLLGLSLISGIVAPGFAVMKVEHPGAWSGGWWEKNQLGGHAARAVFLYGFLVWRDAPWRKLWIGAAVISLALVALSTSATALLGTLLGLAVLVSAWWMIRSKTHALLLTWAGVSVLGVLAILFIAAPGVLLSLIGREPTLTGRTDIWDELLRAISERPTLGYGYLAFWGVDSEPRYWLAKAVDWNAPSGHNGWLDLAISLGIVGVIVFAIDFAVTAFRAASLSLRSPVGVFCVGFLIQYLLFAMSESIIAQQNSILWATYVMISAKLALGRSHARADQRTFGHPAITPGR